jgi:hypothetical protein
MKIAEQQTIPRSFARARAGHFTTGRTLWSWTTVPSFYASSGITCHPTTLSCSSFTPKPVASRTSSLCCTGPIMRGVQPYGVNSLANPRIPGLVRRCFIYRPAVGGDDEDEAEVYYAQLIYFVASETALRPYNTTGKRPL